MASREDPVQRAGDGRDLYDVATWEPRSRVDRLSTAIYVTIVRTVRAVVILAALAILAAQFAITGLAAVTNPVVGAFTLLSVLPALGIALYVWRAKVSTGEPLRTLVGTFLLGVLFAGFAAILNALAQPGFSRIPVVGVVLFFFLVVAPVEETVKWLAVRLYAYRRLDAVIDGAVYGAAAGLGFATIENALYIGQQYVAAADAGGVGAPVVGTVVGTAAVRSFAGPGHVIYSAFAGYYLGLAKFNRAHAGPIVVKGLLIAAVLHATYNSLVGIVPAAVAAADPRVPPAAAFIGFVVVYDGLAGYLLYRKIAAYRSAFVTLSAGRFLGKNADRAAIGAVTDGDGSTDDRG